MSDWLPLLRPGWLLLLLPLGLCLWLLRRHQQRAGAWQQLLPAAFQPWLLTRVRLQRSPWPWRLLLAGWLLAVLALAGPVLQQARPALPRPAPLVVLVALTPDLLASDLQPSRLQQVIRKLHDLLRTRAGGSTAIILYAGSAHILLPLSTDVETGRNLLGALHPDLMPLAGQRADLAVGEAIALLERSGEGRGRLLLLASSLSDAELAGIRQPLQDSGLPLDILGVGSETGAPVPEGAGLQREADGRIRISRLDSHRLALLASQHGGHYSPLTSTPADLRRLEQPALAASASTPGGRLLEDAGHWLLLPLLLLAALAGRRGWLLMLGGCLLLPPPAQAFEWQDLWWRRDQQGWHLLQDGQPAEAAARFTDPRWQGIAWYAAGDYTAAARAFAGGSDAIAHYNLGNALAHSGELEAAIDAWDQALQIDPQLQVARDNRERVRQLLQGKPAASAAPAAASSGPSAAQGSLSADTAAGTGNGTTAGAPAGLPPAGAAPGLALPPGAALPASSGSESAPPDLQQWLRQIPDNPGELLRRKFRSELQQRQESQP